MENSAIGNVSIYYLVLRNTNDELLEVNVSKGFYVNPLATYNQVNQASLGLSNLTTNTYEDAKLVTNVSVKEVLAS